MNRLRLYLAGKISKHGWRHTLVPSLRDHQWSDGDIDCGSFIYVGPYFVSCDHGCYHGPGRHGALLENDSICSGDLSQDFRPVSDRAIAGVKSADLIFGFAETTDCLGSMYELGLAEAFCIPVVLCVKTGVDVDEFRFVGSRPNVMVKEQVDEKVLPMLLIEAIGLIAIAKRRWAK